MDFGAWGALAARTAINNGWTVLAACMLIVFVRHILDKTNGVFPLRQLTLSNKMALAIATYFLGETIARGWTVAFLLATKYGNAKPVEDQYGIALIGSAIALIGGLWMIKIFSPQRWTPWGWIFCGMLAIAFSIFMAVVQ